MNHDTRDWVSFKVIPLILLSILTTPCLAADRRQMSDRPLQGFDQLDIPVIAKLGIQVMQQLGYQIQEATPESGYLSGTRIVPQDPFGRKTELKITIQPGNANQKIIHMEAASCRGCVPGGHLDPQFLMNEFYVSLNNYLAQAKQLSATLNQAGNQQGAGPVQWIGEFPPPAGSSVPATPTPGRSEAILPAPPPGKSPADESRPLTLNRVEVKPAAVAPGEQFTVEVSYTTLSKGTVDFITLISAGGQKLFESHPKSFEAVGNRPGLITSRMTAANRPGDYTIRVRLTFGASSADGEALLTVTPKK